MLSPQGRQTMGMAMEPLRGPRRRRLLAISLLGGSLGLAAASGGCRGQDIFFDCEDQEAAFRSLAEREGPLLESTPRGEPYPVAIKYSEAGLNQLLSGVVNQDVPFTGQLPFVWFEGPGTLEFEATTDPVLELESLEGCATCVQFAFDFNVVLIGSDEEPAGAGIGSVKFRVPLELEPDGEDATLLIADYTRLRVQDLWLSAFGLETEDHQGLVAALGQFMEEEIQASYERTELLRLASWEIGVNNEIRLLARKLLVFPEQDTLVLAMQSNLPLPAGGGLEIDGEMPMGVPMVAQFDVALLQAMLERLLSDGTIPRVYNEDGDPDPGGNYGVTIDSLVGSAGGQETLINQFRVWRFAEGYCGYAVAQMDLDVELSDAGDLRLVASDVGVIGGEGSGAIAAEEDQFVEDNQEVVDFFRAAVVDNLDTTINYDALDIEGSNIVFTTLERDLQVDHLDTWIDFVVVEEPEGG